MAGRWNTFFRWDKTAVPTNSPLHRWLVWHAGRQDGKRQLPAHDDPERPEYERRLLYRGNEHLEHIARAYRKDIEKIEGTREHLIDRFRSLLVDLDAEIDTYRNLKSRISRNIHTFLSRRAWLVLISLIVAGEAVFNAQAFGVLHEPRILQWLMALAVVVGLPVSAHGIGIMLRQWARPGKYLYPLLITVVVVGALYGLNEVRLKYLQEQSELTAASLSSASEPGDIVVLKWAFFFINLFVVFTAALITFLAHDADKALETSSKKLAESADRLRGLDRAIASNDLAIQNETTRSETENIEMASTLRESKLIIRSLVAHYRRANMRTRDNSQRPTAFLTEPEFEDPVFEEVRERTRESEITKLRTKWHATKALAQKTLHDIPSDPSITSGVNPK